MRTASGDGRARPGVNFFGPFGIVGGLGSAARGYLAAMREVGVPLSVIPVNEMFVHHASVANAERGERPQHPISIVLANADSVRRFLYFRSRSFRRSRYKIALWVWELPALRDEWWSEIQHFDEIWVPSAYCRRAVQAMTKKPVNIMPYVVSPFRGQSQSYREKLNIEASAFVFLYIFDAASFETRKNPRSLVNAFKAAFPQDVGVYLVLKVSNLHQNPGFSNYLDLLVKRDPRFIVLRETLEPTEISGLMCACNCYVSPHRSEGFGLTVAEAMFHGIPAIATDYGGTVDFVSEEVGFPLAYRLIEVERGEGPYPKGAIWSEPSSEHLKELLALAVADPQAAAAKGRLARARILKDYSAAAVGRLIEQRLDEIGAR